jgi:hypothetical protein
LGEYGQATSTKSAAEITAAGLAVDRDRVALRTANQPAYIRLIEPGAGIGVIPKVIGRKMPDLIEVLPTLETAVLPIWLIVHRAIRDDPLIRITFDHLAAELPGSIVSRSLSCHPRRRIGQSSGKYCANGILTRISSAAMTDADMLACWNVQDRYF